MQDHARRYVPAFIVVMVHAVILMGLQSLRPKPQAPPEDDALPIMMVERQTAPLPPLSASGLRIAAPLATFAITMPDVPLAPTAPQAFPTLEASPLGDYIACGLGQALTDDDRARCDKLRHELYARPNVAPNPEYDRELAQRYARDKAIQDDPLLRVCYRRSGPDPLCFSRGYEVLYGAAARDSIPLPIGDPLRPR